jgi:acyl carrier protein
MVLDDGYLMQLSEQRFESVMAPKADAAWNLHRATSGQRLDYFMMFSSISSWIGTVGQGNYAAANALLDALALHRRACGLPALAVHWGAIADAGYVARNANVARQLDRQGVLGLKTSDAMAALDLLLRKDAGEVAVARMDFANLKTAASLVAAQRRFSQLIPADGDTSRTSKAGQLLEVLRSANAEEQQSQLEALLTKEVSKALGIPTAKIEPDQDLTGVGLDSLMSVEIEIALESELGADLPLGFLLGEEITVRELSRRLRELIPPATDNGSLGPEMLAQAMSQP